MSIIRSAYIGLLATSATVTIAAAPAFGIDHRALLLTVPHDDAAREYAYGPAQGLPDSKVSTFTQARRRKWAG